MLETGLETNSTESSFIESAPVESAPLESAPLEPTAAIRMLVDQMEKVIRGKRKQIELVVTCLLAGGHILIEDNPGTGKTVLAKTLAHSISCLLYTSDAADE